MVSFKKQTQSELDSQPQISESDNFSGFDVLAEITTNIQNENPSWSDEQVMSELERIVLTKSYSGPLISIKELKVILSKGLFAVFKVNNLKTEAENKANKHYSSTGTLYRGDGDAFRHVYFSALLYRDFDKQFSIELLTAHEENVADLIDKNMDLHNNSRGISLFEVWNKSFKDVALDEFICHTVCNGYFYNIIEILKEPNVANYTTMGISKHDWLNKSLNAIDTQQELPIHMGCNDFIWVKFSSSYLSGTFSIESICEGDLVVEKYSTYEKDGVAITIDDDSGNGLNFKLDFTSGYNEQHYFKIYAYKKDVEYEMIISCKGISTSVMPPSYGKRDKETHFKFFNGTRSIERHIVRAGSGPITNCIYCGESLDLRIHGPFIVDGPMLSPKPNFLYVKELDKWKEDVGIIL